MIASVSKVTSPAPVVNGNAVAAARPVADDTSKLASASPQVESAVVKISAAGAQRSQPTTATLQGAAPDESVSKAGKPAVAESAAEAGGAKPGIAAKLYKDADTNHDGMVSVLEASAYNFVNPSLPSPERLDELAGNRTAVAELQAYASVASA